MHLIAQMGHLTIETPDIEQSVREAEQLLGMRVSSRSEARVGLTSNTRRVELSFISAPSAAVSSIGFEAISHTTLEVARSRVLSSGLQLLSDHPIADGAEAGFVFAGPSGHTFEIHTPVPRDQPAEYLTMGVRPTRLDHVSIMVGDVPQTRDMLRDVLGMQLSDTADNEEFLFMRAADRFHHTVAVVKGPPGLHHFSFEARHLGDLLRVCDQLRHFGRALVWGPGHHGANAQSYFTYYRDGNGCIVEHSFGMTKIANEEIYEPQVWPANPAPDEEWLNLWGAPPSKMFASPGIPVSDRWKKATAA